MITLENKLLSKKGTPDGGEDRIVLTLHFAAVIDGATAKQAYDFGGPTGGALVADTIAATIASFPASIDARSATEAFTRAVKRDVFERFGLDPKPGEDRPCAAFVMYSRFRQEIWRVGDGHFAIDDKPNHGKKKIDETTSALRAALNQSFLASGGSAKALMERDFGREQITPLLQSQPMFMNNLAAGKFAYGFIDGRTVPHKFIQVFATKGAKTVTLASDGYLQVKPSLAESENYLAAYLKKDPLLIGRHASTKGLARGQVSFDDRAWLKLKV